MLYDLVVETQITLGLLGQTYLLSIWRRWISDVNFWKCLSQFCKLRTASPSLAAVCRQSSGCCLPLLYRMLHWSVMSMFIGNCLLCVWREEKNVDGIQRLPVSWQRKKGMGVSRSYVHILWG